MQYDKLNLKVVSATDEKSVRPELKCVFFTDKHTVATNGFCLTEVKAIEGDTINKNAMRGCKPFMVEAGEVKTRLVPLEKVSNISKDLNCGLELKQVDDQNAVFLGLNSEASVRVEKDARFPDYQKIKPTGEPRESVMINWKYLKAVCEVAGEVNGNIEIEFHGVNKPLVIKSADSDRVYGLVMPIVNR